jgi:CubicO group peptidase (beta-lactamase class C family)
MLIGNESVLREQQEDAMRSRILSGTRRVIACIAGIILLAACATAPIRPETTLPGDYGYAKQYLTWLIKKEMKKFDVTGLSIALVDDQRVVWAEGSATRQGEQGPRDAETVYRVGSISKLFTVTAALQLAEQGKLDIDKPLQTYLPEFSIRNRFPDAGPITLRSIMTHHSGLPSDLIQGMWTKDPEPFTSVASRLKDEYTAYPPNYVFSYSNLAMTLLGHAVERAGGRDFVPLLDDRVLKPLQMTHSSFAPPGPDGRPLMPKGYRNGKETKETPVRDVPAGALQSTVLDLGRFILMVFAEGRSGDQQILKPETLAEMLRPQNTGVALDLNFHIGLGWMLSGLGGIDIRNAGPVAHHAGGTLLFHSQLIALPQHKLGVVVLSNSATGRRVVDTVATEALKLALEAKTGIKQPERKKPAEIEHSLPPDVLQAYAGWYATVAGPVKVMRSGNDLRAELMNTTMRMVPLETGDLGLRYRLLGLISISLGELDYIGIARATVAGHDILKARLGTQELLAGEKIRPVAVPEAWLRRTGAYELVNRGDDVVAPERIRLLNDDGLLFMEFSLPLFSTQMMRVAIAPVSIPSRQLRPGTRHGRDAPRCQNKRWGDATYSGYLLLRKQE